MACDRPAGDGTRCGGAAGALDRDGGRSRPAEESTRGRNRSPAQSRTSHRPPSRRRCRRRRVASEGPLRAGCGPRGATRSGGRCQDGLHTRGRRPGPGRRLPGARPGGGHDGGPRASCCRARAPPDTRSPGRPRLLAGGGPARRSVLPPAAHTALSAAQRRDLDVAARRRTRPGPAAAAGPAAGGAARRAAPAGAQPRLGRPLLGIPAPLADAAPAPPPSDEDR